MAADKLLDQVRKDLERHEGRKNKLYRCSAGKLTGGVGFNFDDNPIPEHVIDLLLDHSIRVAITDLRTIFGGQYDSLPDHVRRALINMSFQLGGVRFSKFNNTIKLIKQGEYKKAAAEVLDSKWAKEDSPSRAQEVSKWLAGDL